MNTYFLVRPLETVFFGPPRSATAGETYHSQSQFPPTPTTFQGLVRSQLLWTAEPSLDLDDWSRKARQERAALVGEPDSLPGGWQIQGPFPTCRVPPDHPDDPPLAQPWTPVPRFLLHPPDGQTPPVRSEPVRSTQPGLCDLGSDTPLLGQPRSGRVKAMTGWIGPDNLYHALTGRNRWQPRQHGSELPPFVGREQRPGVAIDSGSATARHGLLYNLDALRFQAHSGLLGHFRGRVDARIPDRALTTGCGLAGRKGRPVAFEPPDECPTAWQDLMAGRHLPDTVNETDGFWLLALTPVRLSDPRRPRLNPSFGRVSIHIHAALTGSPLIVGGYAMANGRSRPNRAYTPGGSAWWFTLTGGDAEERADTLQQLNNAHILGDPDEAAFGYGHTLVGIGPAKETPL